MFGEFPCLQPNTAVLVVSLNPRNWLGNSQFVLSSPGHSSQDVQSTTMNMNRKQELFARAEDFADEVGEIWLRFFTVSSSDFLSSFYAVQRQFCPLWHEPVSYRPSLRMDSECGSSGANNEIIWIPSGAVDTLSPPYLWSSICLASWPALVLFYVVSMFKLHVLHYLELSCFRFVSPTYFSLSNHSFSLPPRLLPTRFFGI